MNNIIENGNEHKFANGQNSRDLRDNSDATQHDLEDLRERIDSSDGLEALRQDSDEALERRIELPELLMESTGLRAAARSSVATASEFCCWRC
jgi:hypothetical protein